MLKECLKLIEKEAELKRELKTAQDALNLEVFKTYPTLAIDEIKELVIEDKWLNHINTQITEEIERITSTLANRIKTLEERYADPLPQIESDVKTLTCKVEAHLKSMGLSW